MRTEGELTKRLNELEITFRPTPIRVAGLYINLIEATHAFFFRETTKLQEYSFNEESFSEKVRNDRPDQISPGTPGIAKILPAIRKKGLLNHLFEAPKNKHGVPAYILPAIDNIRLSGESKTEETAEAKEKRRPRVMQEVLPDGGDWIKKREEFYKTHPIVRHATRTTVLNFWNNISHCCGRVLADWGTINSVFFPGRSIQQLTEIKVTDSDPHKGGKQVLILTFDYDKKIVYKPSDLEADCLLIGQSKVLNDCTNKDLRGFFEIKGKKTQSLMEIVNERIEKEGKLHPLPTYKILPCNPGSKTADIELRNSYGYLEFLSHEDSDYKIEKIQSKALVDQKIKTRQKQQATKIAWSETAGQLMALAVTFSLTDMHAENVIAHQYKPYLIDLETSFTNLVEKIQHTEINRAFLDLKLTESHLNCLRINEQVFDVNQFARNVSFSFVEMLRLLEKGRELFRDWLQRLTIIRTRVVPFETDRLINILDAVYKAEGITQVGDLDKQLRAAIETEVPFENLQEKFVKKELAEPKHLLTKHKQFIEDFKNLDIPVFYRRIGTLYLLNSMGERVGDVDRQYRREYFNKDPFETIKEEQIDNLGQERIMKLTKNLLEFWPGKEEISDKARAALLAAIKKTS
jgi:hypothetical protein